MDIGQITAGIIVLLSAIGALIISCFQFAQKGYLINNAYLWASKEERRKMDENKESKRPHYLQSGFVFMFIGISFLVLTAYIFTHWKWMYIAFWLFMIIDIIYAILSSVQIECHK